MKKSYILFLMAGLAGSTSGLYAQGITAIPTIKLAQRVVEKTAVVSGVIVSDATDEPLAGINLQVVGTKYSAMTGDDGTFEIKVPVDESDVARAEISIKGPSTTDIVVPVRNRREIKIRLMDAGAYTVTNREVITPLGFREQSHIGSATSVITTDNSLSVKGGPEAAMQGLVAGLQTQFRSGAEWSGANLMLRGYNSIYANNNPLLIIDGMVIENAQFGVSMIEGQISTPLGCIDVKDIEQIAVLKDASAIYGAKGGNGAILIQTKRNSDFSTHIDVSALWGMNMQPKKMPVLNATDSKRYLTDLAQTSSLSSKEVNALPWVNAQMPERQPNGLYSNSDYFKYNQSTDWQDEIFQQAFKQQYSLNVNGGDETAMYGVSMGFQQKEGLIKGSDFLRFNARVNAALNFSDLIQMRANMNFVYGSKNLSNEGSASNVNPIYTALVKAPFTAVNSFSPATVNGKVVGMSSPALEHVDALNAANPAAVVKDVVSTNNFYRFLGSYALDLNLGKGWRLTETFGLDFNKEREEIFYPSIGIPYEATSQAEITNVQMHRVERLFNLYNDVRLNYKRKVNANIFDLTIGSRYMHMNLEDDFGRGYNSASNYYQTINAGDKSLYQNGGAIGKANWLAAYANLEYSLYNRYFLNVTVSGDASSRYGDNTNMFLVYPGATAAWLISSENWMKNQDWIDHLKLRASFNMTGNDDIGNYNNRQYYISTAMLTSNGLVRGNIKNNDIKPEMVQKINFGLDAAFLNQRLNLSVDVYQNTTKDLLIYSTPASFTGFKNFVENGGELQNRGIEVAVSGRLINKRNFSWDMSLSAAHNHNEVKKLNAGSITTGIGDGTVITRVGSALGIFYGYQTDGIYATTAEAKAEGLYTMNGALKEAFEGGDVRFVDQNGDHVIDLNDRVQIGNPNPDFFGGFVSTMKSHRFTLTAAFNYSVGNDVYNYTRSQLEGMKSYVNQTKSVLNRWRTEGDITNMPKAVFGDPHQNSRFSDRWIEDGSYLKIKEVTLSYDFNIISNFITGLTVFGTCENAFTVTSYKGYDPEIISSSSNNPLYQGVDAFSTPTARTFFVGLKIGL